MISEQEAICVTPHTVGGLRPFANFVAAIVKNETNI